MKGDLGKVMKGSLKFLENTYKNEPKIKVKTYKGLTVDFCKTENAAFILRGLRNTVDMEFEKTIGQANFKMSGIETLFLISSSGKGFISSSVVRDIRKNGGDYSFMVPEAVE